VATLLSGGAQGIGYLLAAIGPVLEALLRSLTGSWTVPIVVMLGVCGAEAAFAWAAGRPGTVMAIPVGP